MKRPLPIDPRLPEIARTLRERGVLVLEAEPGAGKTTRVPGALLDAGVRGGIVVTEPRRLAARLAARHVASERGEAVGGTVGYSVRFESVTSALTRITYVTEGVLLRRLVDDRALAGTGVVVVDEVHERHLETDLILALVEDLRRTTRPDLGLLVMSATLEGERLAAHLGCQRIQCEGRAYPLTIEHIEQPDDLPLERQVASAVKRVAADGAGSVLVFLPGAAEIRRAAERLEGFGRETGVAVAALHGDLPIEEQARAVDGSARRVILATNVAESSVTVDGVTAVVDTGLVRIASHSPWSGLPTLEVAKVSRASASQRAGRAGRLGPGRVIRLFTRGDFETRPAHEKPEIARLDLSDALLLLHGLGVARPGALPFFDPPPSEALDAAESLLRQLDAIDEAGALSPVGQRMLRFPLPPRLARLVVAGEDRGVEDDACLAAALLSERDIRIEARTGFGPGRQALDAPTGPSDVLELIERYRQSEDDGHRRDRLRRLGLDERSVRSAERSYRRLRKVVRSHEARPATVDTVDAALGHAVLAAFVDRIARRRTPGSADLILASGQTARLSEASVVRDAPFLVALDADKRGGRSGGVMVRLASAIEPDWLLEDHGARVEATDELVWNADKGRVDSVSRLGVGSVVLEEDRAPAPPSTEAAALLVKAATSSGVLRDDLLEALAARLALLAEHVGEVEAPPLDEETLAGAVARLAEGTTRLADLDAQGIAEAVEVELPSAVRQALQRDVPEHVTLPGGRRLAVHYEAGKPPWIASRLQDFFGSAEGPRVCRGRLPLTLHLLAPNQRAVQVTTDLAGFWERHYPALRKELGRRYPRHPFPEDGRTAKPPEPKGPPRRR